MKKNKRVTAVRVAVCVLCMIALLCTSVSAYYEEKTIYLDCDNDGYKESYIKVYPDSYENKATVTYINSDADKVVIPAVVDFRDDYWDDWYDDDWYYYDDYYDYEDARPLPVTAIDIQVEDADYQSYKSIVIPSTVTYIKEETIGYRMETRYEYDEDDDNDDNDDKYDDDYDYDYDYDGDDYDDGYDDDYGYYYGGYEEYQVKVKVEGFIIYCTPGSAAEAYAQVNGFEIAYISDISTSEISLSADSFYYQGSYIKPDVTVVHNAQVLSPENYEVLYCNNKNIGTAEVIIVGKGDFTGTITKTFQITTIPASLVEVSAIEDQYYDGWEKHPYFRVTYNGESIWNYDYTITSNINPGKAKIVITFDSPIFEGTKTVYFNIILEPMEYLNVTALSDSEVYLTWNYVPCGKYYVYRYDEEKGSYVRIARTSNTYYTDKNLEEITKYQYAVKAVKSSKSNTAIKKAVRTMLKTPELTLVTKNKAADLKWTKNSKADGYQIYRSSNWADEKKVKTIKDYKTTKWTNTKLNNDYDYFFCIRAYKKIGGKTYYSQMSHTQYSGSSSARVNGANLKSHTSFKVYNVQGTKTTFMYNINLSESDIKLLDNFKKKNFKEGMTREEQLQVTLNWINQNVKYALNDDWTKISGKSWVEAIFKYKLGQCAQYNGAMAAMMAYLGYDVQVVMGYRGTWKTNYWQHFWTEVKIQGSTYIVETGNYGRSGGWSYLVRRYSEAPGYIKNQKNL